MKCVKLGRVNEYLRMVDAYTTEKRRSLSSKQRKEAMSADRILNI
jgi:hypothetical protein